MTKPTIYTVAHPDDLSPPVANQGFCVDVVLASEYALLQQEISALDAINRQLTDEHARELRAYEATVENLEAKVAALVAESSGLKSNLMFWDWDDPEMPYESPEEIADSYGLKSGEEFTVMVAEKMPNRVYRASGIDDGQCLVELVEVGETETPATDAAIAEFRAQGVELFANKRGFSFQHGSIYAHFGNGDVMVGTTKFENGYAGICFAPVRDGVGVVGTEYEWTNGKTTDEVGSVFVISSSNAAGLEVIQGKLAEAIEQLRAEASK